MTTMDVNGNGWQQMAMAKAMIDSKDDNGCQRWLAKTMMADEDNDNDRWQ